MKRKEACEVIGCHFSTIKRYVKKGYIRVNKLPSGNLEYNREDVYAVVGRQVEGPKKTVAYIRVSKDTKAGRALLEKQKHLINEWATVRGLSIEEVYEDLSPGTNSYRTGYNDLLRSVLKREVSNLVIHTKCRLDRFAYFTVRTLLRYHGVKIHIVSPVIEDPSYLEEQTDDIAKLLAEAKIERIKNP